jgi:hypothetical protein
VQEDQYIGLSRNTLNDARELLSKGDCHEASEKFWGAAAIMVKAAAHDRGWPHSGHRDLHRAVSRLAQETGQREIVDLFGMAAALHTNFYEDWFTEEQVRELGSQVGRLVDELAAAAGT